MCKGKLLKNAAKCRKCGTVVESKYRHDFVPCPCGRIFVDGGLDYQRWGWQSGIEDCGKQDLTREDLIEDMSVYDGNCKCEEEVIENDCYA